MAMRKAQELGKDTPDAVCWNYGGRATAELNHGRSGGNGALMRAVYPALYYPEKERALQETVDQGRMTHWDADSDEACKIYADVLHSLMVEAANGNSDRGSLIPAIFHTLEKTRYALEAMLAKGRADQLKPTGYVVDSLECALYALWEGSADFDEAVIIAANMGGDADTIAAICGGLAGALHGFTAIPQEWIAALSEADRARLDAAVEAAVMQWQ